MISELWLEKDMEGNNYGYYPGICLAEQSNTTKTLP
jgi:hypothetical protein